MGQTITIYFVNNLGGGFAEPTSIEYGTTVGDFFKQKIGAYGNPGDYAIRLSRRTGNAGPAVATDRLEEGDRLTITPKKIAGAAAKKARATKKSSPKKTAKKSSKSCK